MAAGRHFEKKENRNNSAAIWVIVTKFGVMVDMDSPQRAVTPFFDLYQNPIWRPAAILKKENRHNSAAVSDIFTKFGALVVIGSPQRAWRHFWAKAKSKMASGHHFEKRKIAKTRQLFEMSSQIL